jgi:hypothetical protein
MDQGRKVICMKKFIAGLSVLALTLAFGVASADEILPAFGSDSKDVGTELYTNAFPSHDVMDSEVRGAGAGGGGREMVAPKEKDEITKIWDGLLKPSDGTGIHE